MRPIERCPRLARDLHNVKVPAKTWSPTCTRARGVVQHRIIFGLLEPALALPGHVAECGVWQGSTPDPDGAVRAAARPRQRVMGFDSFQAWTRRYPVTWSSAEMPTPQARGGFSNTSYEAVAQRVRQFGLSGTVTLAAGYFQDTLPRHADSRFCFSAPRLRALRVVSAVSRVLFSRIGYRGRHAPRRIQGSGPGRLARRRSTSSSPAKRNESSRSRATTT